MDESRASIGPICKYRPFVYELSGRVSKCFYNTACGLTCVGLPMNGRCKECDRLAIKVEK
jgi:hypothetical protein